MVSSWTLLLQKIPWYEWDYMLFSPLDTQPHWTKNIQCFESLQLLDTEIFQVKLFLQDEDARNRVKILAHFQSYW